MLQSYLSNNDMIQAFLKPSVQAWASNLQVLVCFKVVKLEQNKHFEVIWLKILFRTSWNKILDNKIFMVGIWSSRILFSDILLSSILNKTFNHTTFKEKFWDGYHKMNMNISERVLVIFSMQNNYICIYFFVPRRFKVKKISSPPHRSKRLLFQTTWLT